MNSKYSGRTVKGIMHCARGGFRRIPRCWWNPTAFRFPRSAPAKLGMVLIKYSMLDHMFCGECIRRGSEVQIGDNSTKITCFQEGCSQEIELQVRNQTAMCYNVVHK